MKYEPDRYSKVGFKPPSALSENVITVNIGELEELAMKVISEFNSESSVNELDLTSLGIHKLLGRGSIRVPLKVRVESYSNNAKEKIEEAGGSLAA